MTPEVTFEVLRQPEYDKTLYKIRFATQPNDYFNYYRKQGFALSITDEAQRQLNRILPACDFRTEIAMAMSDWLLNNPMDIPEGGSYVVKAVSSYGLNERTRILPDDIQSFLRELIEECT